METCVNIVLSVNMYPAKHFPKSVELQEARPTEVLLWVPPLAELPASSECGLKYVQFGKARSFFPPYCRDTGQKHGAGHKTDCSPCT